MVLDGKVILVTGSTSGIGAAVARRCVAEGARVMLHGLDADDGRAIRADLDDDVSAFIAADLADPDAPARLVAAVVERFGRIDGLVNNAAYTARCTIDTVDAPLFDRVLAVNVRAPMLLIQAAMPHFRAQGGGVVVNVGSVNAYAGERNLLAYSISKGGLTTLTRNLADALAEEGVRINQVNPGWTFTENEDRVKRAEGFPEGWATNLPKDWAPAGRIFRPEEMAGHIVFWLSDAAGPVNGAVFEVAQRPLIGRNPPKDPLPS